MRQPDPPPNVSHTRALAVAAIPLAVTLSLFVATLHRLPPSGDEPHYVIMARSLLRDRDLDLKNNYRQNDSHLEIIPHVYVERRGWVPYHGPGPSFLIAPWLAVGGTDGARVALCLFSGLLGWTLSQWLAPMIGAGAAAWTIAGVLLCTPIVFGSWHVYPDLPAGVLTMALTCWLLIRGREPRASRAWPLFWLVSGLLPWLNPKFARVHRPAASGGPHRGSARGAASPAARRRRTDAVGRVQPLGVRHGLRCSRAPRDHAIAGARLDDLPRSSSRSVARDVVAAAAAPGRCGSARSIRPPAAARGMVLWRTLSVAARAQRARARALRSRRTGWAIRVVGDVVVDRADRRRARVVPSLAKWIRPAVVAAIVYQVAIAVRWIAEPRVLLTRVDPPRDSLFADRVAPWLPSFYTWDFVGYLSDPVNHIAFAITVLLIAGGALAARRSLPSGG